MWFFGLWWMVAATVIMVTLLVILDHAGLSGFGAREGDDIDDEEVQAAEQEVVRRLSVWQGPVSETSGLDLLPPDVAAEARERARSVSSMQMERTDSVEAAANVQMDNLTVPSALQIVPNSVA
jgi:hypothetical protein